MCQKNFVLILILLSAGVWAGCAQSANISGGASANSNANVADEDLNPNILTSPVDIAAAIPSCEVDIPQLQIGGNVNAFEFSGSVGVTFGFTPSGLDTPIAGATASLTVSKADMDLSMMGIDPMSSEVQVTDDITSAQTSTTLNAQIDFSLFSVDPQLFFQTPLATVTSGGLTKGIAGLKTQSDKMPWIGRVLKHVGENEILLNAGSQAGLMVGDVLNVYNVTHFWSGSPCASTYYGSTRNSTSPDAIVKIVLVSDTVSLALPTSASASSVNLLEMGAEVAVGTLAPAPKGTTRYLKKYVTLGTITSENFTLPGGGSFDFQGVMNSQIINVMNQSGAYVFTAN